MTHYAVTLSDNAVTILQTVGDAKPEDCIAKWSEEARARVVSFKQIDPGIIPQDRTFRVAWRFNGDAIDHDMTKARNIKRDQLRAERAPLLVALDIDYQRADERGDASEKVRIAGRKQALRDATANPAIEAAQTPDELKAIRLGS